MDLLLIIDVFFEKNWKPERLLIFLKEENDDRPERPVFIFIAISRSCNRFDVVYFDEIIQFHFTNFMYTELFSER